MEADSTSNTNIPPTVHPGMVPMMPMPMNMPMPMPIPEMASLYVGDLPQDMTESVLFDKFKDFGGIAFIRMPRDATTRYPLGYAYVNFTKREDAEQAMNILNLTPLRPGDLPCRVMWAQRDPALRESGVGNIFIKNLDPSIEAKELSDTFAAFGNILSCKVMKSNGSACGFVHFENAKQAEEAIRQVDGMMLKDSKVSVMPYIPKRERKPDPEKEKQFTSVFVKNLDLEIDEEEFQRMFEEFGAISSAVLSKDASGKSRGFGFVNYESYESAAKAVETMNGKEIRGKSIFVGRSKSKTEREQELRHFQQLRLEERSSKYQGTNLYIKNLDASIDDERLRQEFSPFGTIASAKIMRDEKGGHRGFGFVCFSSPEEATKAVNEMNGRMLANKRIYVALAQSSSDRRMMLASQQSMGARIPGMHGMIGMPNPLYPHYPMAYNQPSLFPGARPPPFMLPQPVAAGSHRPRYPMFNMPGIRPVPGFMTMPPMSSEAVTGQHTSASRQKRQPVRPGMMPMPSPVTMINPTVPTMSATQPTTNKNRSYKYTSNVRNSREQQQQQPNGTTSADEATLPTTETGAPPVPGTTISVPSPAATTTTSTAAARGGILNAAALAAAAPNDQKQMLGEHLFPLVKMLEPTYAGKITGMLLEMDNAELLHLLESREALENRVNEARQVLLDSLREPHDSSTEQKTTVV